MIGQINWLGQNKIDVAIRRIKTYEKIKGKYYLAYSGGKDSIVIKKLADMADVNYQAYYNLTTVDPPEIVQKIKKDKTIKIVYPEISMKRLIEKKMLPPTRRMRYCCSYFKENNGVGEFVITGVRHFESSRRKKSKLINVFNDLEETNKINLMNDNNKKRKYLENCQIKSKLVLNPILDWTDSEVWSFIKMYDLDYPELYNKGFSRIGCIGCPMATVKQRKYQFNMFPKYYEYYLDSFKLMLLNRNKKNKYTTWRSPEEVMEWWIN